MTHSISTIHTRIATNISSPPSCNCTRKPVPIISAIIFIPNAYQLFVSVCYYILSVSSGVLNSMSPLITVINVLNHFNNKKTRHYEEHEWTPKDWAVSVCLARRWTLVMTTSAVFTVFCFSGKNNGSGSQGGNGYYTVSALRKG